MPSLHGLEEAAGIRYPTGEPVDDLLRLRQPVRLARVRQRQGGEPQALRLDEGVASRQTDSVPSTRAATGSGPAYGTADQAGRHCHDHQQRYGGDRRDDANRIGIRK